jgi:hypothetical protein
MKTNFTFRCGRRYAVNFHEINIKDYDPGYRAVDIKITDPEGDTITVMAQVYKRPGLNKKYKKSRKAVIAIIRSAFTGIPYAGVAVVHPDDKSSTLNLHTARMIAARRAVMSMVASGTKRGSEAGWRGVAHDIFSELQKEYYVGIDNEIFARLSEVRRAELGARVLA